MCLKRAQKQGITLIFRSKLSLFTTKVFAPVILLAILTIALPLSGWAQTASRAGNQTPVPDVLILVMSGIMPTDGDVISFTYNTVVSKDTVKGDTGAFSKVTGFVPRHLEIANKDKATSVQFNVDSVVDWSRGIVLVEPFALTFKRFNNIQVSYLLGPNFTSRSLRNYSDKNVDIRYTSQNRASITYLINVKDHNISQLGLPLVVEPQSAKTQQPHSKQERGGGSKILLAMVIALAAAALVFVLVGRANRK